MFSVRLISFPARLLACFVLCATGTLHAQDPAPAKPLPVVATFSILQDIAQNIGGDKIQVLSLVGPDGDPHAYEPTPSDAKALKDAALVLEIGVGFEGWLGKLYTASGSKAPRVVTSKKVDFIHATEEGREHEHGEEAARHEDVDPHIWNDVLNGVLIAEAVRDGLVAADSKNAAVYQANAKRYIAELQELQKWVEAQVQSLPPERRKLVTNHDTFGYFAKRNGFTISGTALSSLSTESSDPSARQIAQLIESIKKEKIPAIFAEFSNNQKLVERVAQEAGVVIAPPLYAEALGDKASPAASYIELIRYNVTTIVTALKP